MNFLLGGFYKLLNSKFMLFFTMEIYRTHLKRSKPDNGHQEIVPDVTDLGWRKVRRHPNWNMALRTAKSV